MPRVHHVKKARKPFKAGNGVQVNVGDSYYWWKFRFGGKRTSTTPPKPQQLTQSGFAISIMDLQERISNLSADESLESERDEIVSDIENLQSEQQDSLDNMPEQLQESSVLNERIEALEQWASDLQDIECNVEDDDLEIDDELADELEEMIDEVIEEMGIEDASHMNKEETIEYEKLLTEKKEARKEELLEEKRQEKYEDILSEIQSTDFEG